MTEDQAMQKELEEVCRRIEALAEAAHLCEEEKLAFARQALRIVYREPEEEVS